jgi:valyl-tRNA synthetase
MKSIAGPALEAVESDEIEFFPTNQKNLYRHWMENIRDWCISRQLWWGHRIPAYYLGEEVFVAPTLEEAVAKATEKLGRPVRKDELRQDEDVLDTWFSSWLWPITVFDGFESREELDYYYPTSVLVTGWDIIFLWVARMAMAGYQWEQKRPFEHVYFTGMVRDKKGRKMSKSLGNSPDALKLIDTYGADGVRFGMMNSSPAGGDLLFDEKLCEQGRNFCNKIWQAMRLLKNMDVDQKAEMLVANRLALDWIRSLFNKTLVDVQKDFETYRLSEALTKLYSFLWTEFCSWFLEMIKPNYGESIDPHTLEETIDLFSEMMIALHPYMPFISEEVYHTLKDQEVDCCVSTFPKSGKIDEELIKKMDDVKTLVSSIRDMRNKAQVKKSDKIGVFYTADNQVLVGDKAESLQYVVSHLAGVSELASIDGKNPDELLSFLSGTAKYYAKMEKEFDAQAEIAKIEDEIKYLKGFMMGIEKKLGNERFVNNAPEAVVAKERKKLEDSMTRIKILEENLAKYKN